jgi:hypothetical protein
MPAHDGQRRHVAFAHIALWLVFAWYVGYTAGMHYRGHVWAAEGERPWYTDFTHTYAASLLLRSQPAEALYRDDIFYDSMVDAAHAAYGPTLSHAQAGAINFGPWMYPPPFIFVVAPLALFPYLPAYLLWVLATAVPYLAAMRAILRAPLAWPFALAPPTTYANLMYGQTGFLSAGLIGLGLAQLTRRPVVAGVLIGLASVKPHLGLLIPLALLAGRYWKAFTAASATTVALAVLSALVYGIGPWLATLGSIGYYAEGFERDAYNLFTMTSVLSTVRVAGGSVEAMWLAQNVSTLVMAALVAWVWWRGAQRPETLGLRAAILCFAAPLAVPMVYVYDLALLVPGAAWLWCDFRARGARGWEVAVVVVSLGLLLFVYELARATGIQLGAACSAGLLGLALYRYRRAARPVMGPLLSLPPAAGLRPA